jgi:flagellar protein FliO/FliZ
MSRSAAHADAPGVQLPAQQPYAVQLQAPLFTHGLATDASAPTTTSASPSDAATTAAAQADVPVAEPQAPVGVPEPAGLGGDLVDIGIKLVAVLALAYGSLLLLKRFGVGGLSASSRAAGPTPGIRVVSSVSLAPNRSVHLVAVPGGKTLLLGATPTAVNLLTELSPED